MTAGRARACGLLALAGAAAALLAPSMAAAATVGPAAVTAGAGPLFVAVVGYTTYLPTDEYGWVVVADSVPPVEGPEGEELTALAGCSGDPLAGDVLCEVASLTVYGVRGSPVADQISVAFEPCDDPTGDCPAPPPRVEIRGGSGADVLRTSNGGRIDAGDGDDAIDIATIAATPLAIDAGPGDDTIVDERSDPEGTTETVTIKCGPGDDTVRFLQPTDTAADDCEHVFADAGSPVTPPPLPEPELLPAGCTVIGTDGDDRLAGTDGDDVICGLAGNDVVSGLGGNDVLFGGTGRDWLLGGSGDDRLDGGADGDSVWGGAGADVVDGGEGDDVLRGEDGDDGLRGGVGDDVAVYLDAPRSVVVDLRAGQASGDGRDTLRGVEQVRGSVFADRLIGSRGPDVLDGSGGGDVIRGGEGRDRLSGGAGDDRLGGGPGRDLLGGGIGVNALDGGGGTDTCFSANGGRRRACELPSPGAGARRVGGRVTAVAGIGGDGSGDSPAAPGRGAGRGA